MTTGEGPWGCGEAISGWRGSCDDFEIFVEALFCFSCFAGSSFVLGCGRVFGEGVGDEAEGVDTSVQLNSSEGLTGINARLSVMVCASDWLREETCS